MFAIRKYICFLFIYLVRIIFHVLLSSDNHFFLVFRREGMLRLCIASFDYLCFYTLIHFPAFALYIFLLPNFQSLFLYSSNNVYNDIQITWLVITRISTPRYRQSTWWGRRVSLPPPPHPTCRVL